MPIWTHSRLESAENCPLEYHWNYLQRRHGYTIASGAGRIGNTIHAALESGLEDPHQDMEIVLQRAIMAHDLTTVEELEALTFRGKIGAFVERFHGWRARHGVTEDRVLIEQRWAIDENFKSVPYTDKSRAFFRGILDLAAVVKRKKTNPVLMIWDHKTGDPSDIEKREKQFICYAVLGLAQYPDIHEVRCAIHYPKTGQVEWYPRKFSAEEIVTELQPRLMERIEAAQEVGAREDPMPVEGWKCTFCKYEPVCPLRGGACQ